MDRDNRWERVKKAYDAIAKAEGNHFDSAEEAMAASYKEGVLDEFVVPCVIGEGNPIANGDSVIFFNFRPDRARQITRALTQADFDGFDREQLDIRFVCMTQYDKLRINLRR